MSAAIAVASADVALPASDPPLGSLDLPGGRLAFTDEGPRDAPALLAVHGVPGSVRDFRYLAPQLTDAIRLVRIDLPGFGGSDPVDDALDSLEGRARVVVRAADALGLDRFSVLGHSLNGGGALLAAARHPARVRLLVLVSSLALSRHGGLALPGWVFAWLARALRWPLLGRLLLARSRVEYRRRRFPGADELGVAELGRHLRCLAAVDFGLLRQAAASQLPPTLVAYAKDDHLVETWVAEELARALHHARVLAFDSGGHNLQKTRASELGQAIREALGNGR